MTVSNFVRAGLLAAALVSTPLAARAQTAAPANTSFDGYRAMAITAGVIAGVAVAVIVTDGLIIPVYAAVTGAETGAIMGGGMTVAGTGAGVRSGVGLVRGTIRLFGAISGGLYADTIYLRH